MESESSVESKRLIVNNSQEDLFSKLIELINECEEFFFSVAFISYSGLQLLLDSMMDFSQKSVKKSGRIITTDYQCFTDVKSLKKLRLLENIEVKIFETEKHNKGFHTKAYVFKTKDEYKIIIGSSNITQSALKENVEWNSFITVSKSDKYSTQVVKEFCLLWEIADEITDEFLEIYEEKIDKLKSIQRKIEENISKELDILPKPFQFETCARLEEIREFSDKALVIAATGTGKTILSAFDVKKFNPRKLLFLAHREDIIRKSAESYKKILGSETDIGFFKANEKNTDSKYIFSTIQTMGRNFRMFGQFDFDYIVYDEAHHVCASQYRKVYDYFRPRFSLGMTATPERMDGADIFRIFDNNVGLDLRLREAMNQNLIASFHYFGVVEYNGILLSEHEIKDIDKLVKKLKNNGRIDYIIGKMEHYGFDGKKRKCLGFCANTEHAKFMVDEFTTRGIPCALVNSETPVNERENLIRMLEDNNNSLEIIFTIDVFNEGIDIPTVNQILLLRPTRSAMIFIQQLGRGLRKHKDKQYLTVIDFIANHSRAFLIAIALYGSKGLDKKNLKDFVKRDFKDFSEHCFIKMDNIIKEQILSQIDSENFYSKKYLLQEFNALSEIIHRYPLYMMDYEAFEYGIDANRFLLRFDSYFDFYCSSIPKDHVHTKYHSDKSFMQLLKQLSEYLPLKRIHEFELLQAIIEKPILKSDYFSRVQKKIQNHDFESCEHALDGLRMKHKNIIDIEKCIEIISVSDELISVSSDFEMQLNDNFKRDIIKDVIQFGMVRYLKDFGNKNFGYPFLKLYETYHYKDIQLVSNYKKSDKWMKGVHKLGNQYYLFVNLIKKKGIQKSLDYRDMMNSEDEMIWQTVGNTNINTPEGHNLANYEELGYSLNVLIRKRKSESGITMPFYYLGKVDAQVVEYGSPISFKLKFKERIPDQIYNELYVTEEERQNGAD